MAEERGEGKIIRYRTLVLYHCIVHHIAQAPRAKALTLEPIESFAEGETKRPISRIKPPNQSPHSPSLCLIPLTAAKPWRWALQHEGSQGTNAMQKLTFDFVRGCIPLQHC